MKEAVSVLVDLDVVQDLSDHLRISETYQIIYEGEGMVSLKDVVKEPDELGVAKTLVVAVLKAVPLQHHRLGGKQLMSSLHRAKRPVVLDVVHNLVGPKTGRKEGRTRPLACKLYLNPRLGLTQRLKMDLSFQSGQSSLCRK